MSDIDAEDRAGGGRAEPDAEMTPELRRAVTVLRRLPPTSPDAVARVAAAVAADRGARASRAWRARVRPWSTGVLAAAAAGLALLVAGGRGRWPGSRLASETPPGSGHPGAGRSAPVPVMRAVGNAHDGALGDVRSADAPRSVTFVLHRPDARAVAVVGDFNRWNAGATPLTRRSDGGWAVTVSLAPGRHAYRFVVDDSLHVLDPSAPAERDADLGVARSIVVVGVP